MPPTEDASSVESSLTIDHHLGSPAILSAVRHYRNLSLCLSVGLLIRLSNDSSNMLEQHFLS